MRARARCDRQASSMPSGTASVATSSAGLLMRAASPVLRTLRRANRPICSRPKEANGSRPSTIDTSASASTTISR